MVHSIVAIFLILGSLVYADENNENRDTDDDVVWLNWPVTGAPYNGVDDGILMPAASSRFSADVKRDVIIGLKSDGTVVWKTLNSNDAPNPSKDSFPDADENLSP